MIDIDAIVNSFSDFDESSSTDTDDEMIILPFTHATYIANYFQQNFSFPDTIMHYILKNPFSFKCYQKAVKVCKYFFINNPIIVVNTLQLFNTKTKIWALFDSYIINNFKNITSKVWVTQDISFRNETGKRDSNYFITLVLPKIYPGAFDILFLTNQNFLFNDFLLLASKCKRIFLHYVTAKNEDGTVIKLEKIVAALPKLISLKETAPKITSKTVQELLKIPHFRNFAMFSLEDIPEAFDIESFHEYIKNNKNTKISLRFSSEISDAYKNQLQGIINEIVAANDRNSKTPYIFFYGMDIDAADLLFDLHNRGEKG